MIRFYLIQKKITYWSSITAEKPDDYTYTTKTWDRRSIVVAAEQIIFSNMRLIVWFKAVMNWHEFWKINSRWNKTEKKRAKPHIWDVETGEYLLDKWLKWLTGYQNCQSERKKVQLHKTKTNNFKYVSNTVTS